MSGYPDDNPEAPRPPDDRVIKTARAVAIVPATFLILNGLFGWVIIGLLSVPLVFDPEGFADWAERFVAQQPPSPEKQQAEQDIAKLRAVLNDPEQRQAAVTRGAVILGIPAVINLVAILGGFAMRRLSSRGLSMAGAIASLIPLGTGCCVTGLPFGLWALVTLVRPEVQAGFLARRTAAPRDPDEQYMQ